MRDGPYNPFDALKLPIISEETVDKCRRQGDFRNILFEYYRFVGQLAVVCSCILFESPAWKQERSRKTWEVCAASFSRIKNLVSANLEFFQDDRYIEATQILDRCIFETAAKICWISQDASEVRLRRFLEGSLRPDREHKATIEANIAERGGPPLKIEDRMLTRMQRSEQLSGIGDIPTNDLRRMPDLSVILSEIGHSRSVYVAVGKVGSHAIHGNWQHLLSRNLLEKEGRLDLLHRPGVSDPAQHSLISLFVLEACSAYVGNCFIDDGQDSIQAHIGKLIETAQSEIRRWNRESMGDDFENAV